MIIFDYWCEDCKLKEERHVRNSVEKVYCPQCQGRMRKLLGATRTTFKFADKSGMKRG
jgi:putative FmdB family regulatory protein